MIDKLTAGMKSWIKQDYQDICESPAEYGIADLANEFGKIVDSLRKMSSWMIVTRCFATNGRIWSLSTMRWD